MSSDAQDSSFAASFPLPFRVLFLGGIGILGWATNLHGLEVWGIDVVGAMELRAHGSKTPLPIQQRNSPALKFFPHHSKPYASIYRLFMAYSVWCLLGWALYHSMTHGNVVLANIFRFVPAICGLGVLTALVSPFDMIQKRERDMFLQ
jgi:hypothetical protein